MLNTIKWLSSPEDKILSWRNFRKELDGLPLQKALNIIATTWKNCPKVQKPIIDILEEWPDPWELLSQKVYCDASQALGIYYTLQLSSLSDHTITFEICDTSIGDIQNRIKVDNYYIDLNATKMVNTKPDNNLTVKQSWQGK
jgi:hypothetical protein